MLPSKGKSIFWLEDDSSGLQDYCKALREKNNLDIGAHWELIKRPRQQPVALVIVDLMIHRFSEDYETGAEVENIHFQDIDWMLTGLGFLHRLREGEYESWGLPADVPVIVATGMADYMVRDRAEELGIRTFLEKPFTIEELETAVDRVLNYPGQQEE